MFKWFKPNKHRATIREDRKYLEARARRLLKNYLSSDAPRKQRFYEVVAGAAAACQPQNNTGSENAQTMQAVAEAALKVVKERERQGGADRDQVNSMITDAYATVGIAHRRASAVYTDVEDLLKLGTAAVHLVTIATSYTNRSDEQSH